MSDLTENSKVSGIDPEILKKIGIQNISFGASADTKVNIAQYESLGVFASMSMTFDLNALTGELPVNEIVNEVVMPVRNSFVQFAHPETLTRVNELRAIIEGVRDGLTWSQIGQRVQKERAKTIAMMRESFSKG